MPKGPRGETRPADVIGGAVKVMRIAIGGEPDDGDSAPALSPGAWEARRRGSGEEPDGGAAGGNRQEDSGEAVG